LPSTSKLSLNWIAVSAISFQEFLALEKGQFPQVVSVEVEQIEGDHDDLGGTALQLVL
jgi:hypothetical protein